MPLLVKKPNGRTVGLFDTDIHDYRRTWVPICRSINKLYSQRMVDRQAIKNLPKDESFK